MKTIIKTMKNKANNPNDKIITPLNVAKDMIEKCNINKDMKVLDCSKGEGVFYNNLPICNKDWCEIDEGKDFFKYNEKVDLIIGNPPYSLWDKWTDKTIELNPKKICYIWGNFNLTPPRLNKYFINNYGITYFKILKIDWWFSPSFIVIFEKDKKSIIDIEPNRITCDICNIGKRCGRGFNHKGKKWGMNECPLMSN